MKLKSVLLAIAMCAAVHTQAQNQTPERSPKEKAFWAVQMERDSATFFKKAEQFLKDYPITTTDPVKDKKENVDYYRIFTSLINRSGNKDSSIRKYYDILPYFTVVDVYYHWVELMLSNNLDKPENLIDRSSLLLKKLESWRENKPTEFKHLPDSDWISKNDRNYYGDILTHVRILRMLKKTEEGLRYAKMDIDYYGYKISKLNEDYVLLWQQAGLTDSMKVAAEKSVHENQATPVILAILKELHHNDADFGSYVESLKSDEGKKEMEAELRKAMIKKPFVPLKLYDNHGKLVNSNDWKGKVVVVDYFASWCAPCKASFPGMKMAMEHFANDKDVLFFYVDTEEHDPVKSKSYVLQYIKDNDFPFTILFDKEGKKKGFNDYAASLMGVTAIPRKFIVDKQGNVRFDMDGYYGSPTKLADEVIMMVNLAKQAN